MNERPEGYNIGFEVIGDKCISTAAIPSSSPYIGYFMVYETIIWNWDGKKRTDITHQVSHVNEKNAKKVHDYIVNNITNRMKKVS